MTSHDDSRAKFAELLSAYVDGEVSVHEARWVEQYTAQHPDSRRALERFEAVRARIGEHLRTEDPSMDWPAFTRGVLARLSSEPRSLIDRLKIAGSKLLADRRTLLATAFAGAAAALAIAFWVRPTEPRGYGAARLEIQTVSADGPSRSQPIVVSTERGDAVIWMDQDPQPESQTPAGTKGEGNRQPPREKRL